MKRYLAALFLVSLTAWGYTGDVSVGIRTYQYQVGQCSIEQWQWTTSDGDYANWKVGKGCTEKDITWIENKVKESEMHDHFVSEIGAYFGGQMAESPGSGGVGVPNGATYTGAAWAPGQGGDFSSTFGTSFDSSKLGSTRRGIFFPGEEGAAREDLIRSGAALVYAVASGELSAELSYAGERMGVAWNAVLHGGPADLLSEAQLKAVQAVQLQQLQALNSALIRQTERANALQKDLVIAAEMSRISSTLSVEKSVKEFSAAAARVRENLGQYQALRTQLTTLTQVRVADLHLPDTQIAALRAGKIPETQLNQMRADLAEKMSTPGSLPALQAIQALSQEDQNPFRKKQLEHLWKELVDDRGLVASWAAADSTAQALRLTSDPTSKMGKLIRENINESLQVKQLTLDRGTRARADVAMSLLQVADLSPNGKRQLERARVLLDYLTQHPRVQHYANYSLSPTAQGVFGFAQTADSFEGHQIVDLGERLRAAGNLDSPQADPNVRFHAVTTLQQMKRIAAGGDNLIGFIQLTETGNDLVDYLQGAVGQLRQIAVDTVTGIQQVVLHPVDSAEAIYQAVVNYEKTYELIAAKVESVIDQYPTMSAAEKGALHAQIATELVGAFTGLGAIKNTATSVKAVAGLGRAAAELTGDVVRGVQGTKRLSTLAPELLDAFPLSSHNLIIGRNLLDAPVEFVEQLRDYMQATQLSRREAGWLARFRNGSSYFITKENYNKYVLGGGSTLGGPDGQFVMPKHMADWVQSTAGNSRDAYRKLIGWENLETSELYRVDLPFRFEHAPQMPLGLEDSANSLFIGSGHTTGGIPELVLYQPPKTDILWKGIVAELQ